ncbi:ethanolamine utilization microcompartment protein EutL [Desulforamulus reducens]|uniref:ethanolamine utilization microcompartment protein EutL n=1 Tax=Desulforamulus reducens TaxID=59610 RepID=UPI00059BAF56|nr:ethanolamine utilization microcompartment protein EutL [Desulforamulus reducens]
MLQPIKADILAVKMIPNVSPDLAKSLQLNPDQRSVGMLTCTIDDAGYTAIDEATKKALVEVVYAKSFYAGAAHASGPLSGEFIGIIAGPSPAEVRSGLEAAITMLEEEAFFYTADEEGKIAFYPHVISRTGSYLSSLAGITEGEPLAYLIAPPIESIFAVDAALKAADVEMKQWFGPPSETNFGGALLTGTQSACTAAAEAFKEAVLSVARQPREF